MPTARVEERLGSIKSERAITLIAIHAHNIPHVFPVAVEAESRVELVAGLPTCGNDLLPPLVQRTALRREYHPHHDAAPLGA